MLVNHSIEPVFDSESRVLILGTMPSPQSRATGFYYGHPQNRFWKLLAELFGEQIPKDKEEKTEFLLRHHIALWDVLAQCEISGAQDATIKAPLANDLSVILENAPIRAIFCTGKTAAKWYDKLIYPKTGIPCIPLPSSSPANCAVSMDRMLQAYHRILQYTAEV